VTNDGRGAIEGRTAEWLGLELTVASFTFEDLVRFHRPPAADPEIDRRALDLAVAETERFDGVLAEAPESVLLHYVRHKRGMRPLRWLANVVQFLARVDPLRELVRRAYGDDPLAVAAADPSFRWCVTTRSHVEPLVKAGLPRERITFFPSSTTVLGRLQPSAAVALAPEAPALPDSLRGIAAGVLVAGSNNRDLVTAARAAAIARVPIHVIADLKRTRPATSEWLAYHDTVPLPEFVAAVAHARVLLVPLYAGDTSCGQQTIAIGQRLRTAIVASDVPAAHDYLVDGESGLLVPPGDPAALAAALERVLSTDTSAMLEAGFQRDARDGAYVEHVLREAYLAPLA
jgi:glycosyltransferase involved in cell wall biosynthesis